MAADITYTGANGAWSTAANWDLAQVPAAGDVVRIPAGKEVTLATRGERGPACDARRHAHGRGSTCTVGSGTWSGGAMDGTGTTRVTGTLTHTANTSLDGAPVLAIDGTLELAARAATSTSAARRSIRNTGTIKRTVAGTVADLRRGRERRPRSQGVDLEGGGTGSTGDFTGVQFARGRRSSWPTARR